MCDAHVNCGACRNVAGFAALFFLVRAEESTKQEIIEHTASHI